MPHVGVRHARPRLRRGLPHWSPPVAMATHGICGFISRNTHTHGDPDTLPRWR